MDPSQICTGDKDICTLVRTVTVSNHSLPVTISLSLYHGSKRKWFGLALVWSGFVTDSLKSPHQLQLESSKQIASCATTTTTVFTFSHPIHSIGSPLVLGLRTKMLFFE